MKFPSIHRFNRKGSSDTTKKEFFQVFEPITSPERQAEQLVDHAHGLRDGQYGGDVAVMHSCTLEILDFADDFTYHRELDPDDPAAVQKYIADIHMLHDVEQARWSKGE